MDDFRLAFAYTLHMGGERAYNPEAVGTPMSRLCRWNPRPPEVRMFDPDAGMPRLNRNMVYLGACLIAGIRLAREKQAHVRVVPTSAATDSSIELAHEIYNRAFRKVPVRMGEKG